MEDMKKFGFTLAEVLITLGIIGVVAAMTLPTLIANMNSARFRNQYKKTLSTLSQSGKIAQERFDYNYGDARACSTESDSPFSTYSACAIFNGTLTGHRLKFGLPEGYNPEGTVESSAYPGAKIPNGMPHTPEQAAHVILSDGSMLVFNKNLTGCVLPPGKTLNYVDGTEHKRLLGDQCYAFIDINGPTLPNKEIVCDSGYTDPFNIGAECDVTSDFNRSADIYPIVFHDGSAEPATNAARTILQTTK